MTAEEIACQLIRRFEGLRLSPYLCPAGVGTVGYGSTRYEDGTSVSLTDPPISRERAEALMLHEVNQIAPKVRQLCPGADTPGRQAALIDFTFNLGLGRLKSSTLRKRVNAGDWDAVPTELRKWVVGGGRPLPGLVKRREAEAALC